MSDKFTNNSHEDMLVQKLNQAAERVKVNAQFAAELETRLRGRYRPGKSRFGASLRQVSPTLRWIALMILLGLILSLSIKTLIPAPQPAADSTPSNQDSGKTITPAPDAAKGTPAPQGESFDYGGAKLTVNVSFPASPAQANVYSVLHTMLDAQPATAEYARALADQFGIKGELYTIAEQFEGQYSGQNPFMVTDGKQQLIVLARDSYTYTSDMVRNSRDYLGSPNENAEATIREYLQSHGLGSNFKIEPDSTFSGYTLQQVTPDGSPIEGDMQSGMRVTLNEDGTILSVNASLLSYDPTPLGSYGIIPADEALRGLVAEGSLVGTTEYTIGRPNPDLEPPRHWYHDYPDNQTVTIHGDISSSRAVDPNTAPIIFLENVPVSGNIAGMDAVQNRTFIEATGQFIVENGVREFSIDSWSQDVQLAVIAGSAHRTGEQITLTEGNDSNKEYTLVDPPADLPLDTKFPDSQLVANGVVVDGQFHWMSLQYYSDRSQMGGGGGGGGIFYPLNLSGTPVPFPTPTQPSPYSPEELASFPDYTVRPGDTCAGIGSRFSVSVKSIVSVNNLPATCTLTVGQILKIPSPIINLEGERGIVTVRLFEKPDGRQRTEYIFEGGTGHYSLEVRGDNLESLQKAANLPIKIWGTLTTEQTGPFLTLERFELLYPDLQFQILTGTQETKEIDGEQLALFTTGGKTYVQMLPNGIGPGFNYFPNGNEEIKVEALLVPDETYAGYPAIRVFNSGPATDPVTGKPMELQRTVDQIEPMPDPYGDADSFIPPNITVEHVELQYYAIDPNIQSDTSEDGQAQLYLQPVWHFWGHNDNGDEVHYIAQALRQEYLLPIP